LPPLLTASTALSPNEFLTSDAVLGFGKLPSVNARSRDIIRLLTRDKKTRNGVVHFVLPRAIGKVEVVSDVPEKVVVEAVNELRRLSKPRSS
jgi:3-dehydroquinate synthase